MKLDLRGPLRQVMFLTGCFGLATVFLFFGIRHYIAYHHSTVLDEQNLSAAAELEPGNAEYEHLLGALYFFGREDPAQALEHYRRAAALNPYVARYFLDLAVVYHWQSRSDDERQSLERAVWLDPKTPNVAWEAANFYLTQGDTVAALRQFRIVVENTSAQSTSALDLAWRASHDIHQILEYAVDGNPQAHLVLLQLMIDRKEREAARQVWEHLWALNTAFKPQDAFSYVQFLIDQRQVPEAREAWDRLIEDSAALKPYKPARGNLLVNSGFEEEILNGGFDWRYASSPQVAVSIDTLTFHSGQRALAVRYLGSAADAGVFEYILVQPGTRYVLTAYVKGETVNSASGPRLAIVDARKGTTLLLTDDVIGSSGWRLVRGEFIAGPDTTLAQIKILRQPPEPAIRGQIWIDDVSVSPLN